MSTGSVVMTATGNSSAVAKQPQENYETITILPTAGATPYSTLTFTVEGSVDGTNFEQVLVLDTKTGLTIAGGTSISPTDGTAHTYAMMFANNYTEFRVNVGAIAAGSATFLFNGSTTPPGPALFNSIAGGAGSFTNGTFSGTLGVTGATTLSSTLAVTSTSTLTGAVTAPGGITLSSGADLAFSGTTGQSEITVTDNLADALSIKIASGNDLIVLKSTDSAETIFIGGSAAGQEIFLRPGTIGPFVKQTATTVSTAGAGTLTAAAILGGLILRDPNGGDRTDTTHTAAQLVAAAVGCAVDDTMEFMIVNTADAAETITLAGGSGVTLVPATITIAQNEVYRGKLRFTNVTGSSEAVTIYGGNSAG